MKGAVLKFQALPRERQWFLIAAAFAALGLMVSNAGTNLEKNLTASKEAYLSDRELSRNADRYRAAYQQVLDQNPVTSVALRKPEEWIPGVQEQLRRHGLSMRELTPVAAAPGRQAGLSLSLEGGMPGVLSFIYEISKAPDTVHVSQMTISKAEGAENTVRAEMILSQGE